MKIRSTLVPLLLLVAVGLAGGLTACTSSTPGKGSPLITTSAPTSSGASSSSDSGSSSAPDTGSSTPSGTGNSPFCAQMQAALTNVAGLAGKANDLSAYKSTIAAYISTFNSLAGQAPPSIKGALTDIATALNTLMGALNGGGINGLGALSSIAPRIGTDGQQIGQYIAANCAGI